MNTAVQAVAAMIAAIVIPGIALAQKKPDDAPLKPVTVCEVLANPEQFNGKTLAVLGRSDHSMEGHWLVEDDCGAKLVMAGDRTWPNIIWLECCHAPAPDPPSGSLVIDKDELDRKLQQVRKTTQLKYHRAYVDSVAKDGRAKEWREVKDEWAVVYGRLEVVGEITPPQYGIIPGLPSQKTWNHGFGHLAAAPVQLVINEKNIRSIPDPNPPTPGR